MRLLIPWRPLRVTAQPGALILKFSLLKSGNGSLTGKSKNEQNKRAVCVPRQHLPVTVGRSHFKAKVKTRGLENDIHTDSCGTSNYHIGGPPDSRTVANALTNSVTIDHAGRQLTEDDLDKFDYILAMDASNHTNIFRLPNATMHGHKIHMMRAFDIENGDVPDPYYGTAADFQQVFDILSRSIERFLNHLQEEHNLSSK